MVDQFTHISTLEAIKAIRLNLLRSTFPQYIYICIYIYIYLYLSIQYTSGAPKDVPILLLRFLKLLQLIYIRMYRYIYILSIYT